MINGKTLEDLFGLGFSLHISKETMHAKIVVKDDDSNEEISQMLPRDHHLDDSVDGAINYCKSKLITILNEKKKLVN